MNRPSVDETMLGVARLLSFRGTCPRRQVGAVLTDSLGRVLSTGYNGSARGQDHCSADNPCPGFGLPSGQGLELCNAIHAEENALLFCSDIMKIRTCFVTDAPCGGCIKLLLNTSCQEIVFLKPYAEEHMKLARERWQNRLWTHYQSRSL